MSKTIQSELRFKRRRTHAIQRASGRYGVHLDQNEYAYLNLQIRRFAGRNNQVTRLATLPARRAAYQISYKGRQLIAVYSHHEHQIITFLTADQLNREFCK